MTPAEQEQMLQCNKSEEEIILEALESYESDLKTNSNK
jgi:hypothetical protein